MSLLELRERLALTKEKHEEEEKQKREEIKGCSLTLLHSNSDICLTDFVM